MEEFRNLELYYRRSVALDFVERHKDDKHDYLSEVNRFLKKISESKMVTDGHYQLSLSFREEPPN